MCIAELQTVCVTLESESAWQGWGAGAQSLPDNKAANYGKPVPPALSSMVAPTGTGAKKRLGAGKICLQDNKGKTVPHLRSKEWCSLTLGW